MMAELCLGLGSQVLFIGHHEKVERALELVSKNHFWLASYIWPQRCHITSGCQSPPLYDRTTQSVLPISQAMRIK